MDDHRSTTVIDYKNRSSVIGGHLIIKIVLMVTMLLPSFICPDVEVIVTVTESTNVTLGSFGAQPRLFDPIVTTPVALKQSSDNVGIQIVPSKLTESDLQLEADQRWLENHKSTPTSTGSHSSVKMDNTNNTEIHFSFSENESLPMLRPSTSDDFLQTLSTSYTDGLDDKFFDIMTTWSEPESESGSVIKTSMNTLSTPSDLVVWRTDRQGKHALDRKDVSIDSDSNLEVPESEYVTSVNVTGRSGAGVQGEVFTAAPALLAMTSDPQPTNAQMTRDDRSRMAAATIAGIALAGVGFVGLIAAILSVAIVRRLRRLGNKSFENQFANDNCGYLDSLQVSYISSQTDIPQESSDEMYSLDNDSFLNSLENMPTVDIGVNSCCWMDERRCTKV